MADGENTNQTQADDQNTAGSGTANAGKAKDGGRKESNTPDTAEMLGKVLGGFSKMSADNSAGVSPQITDALTQALLAILGAGPSMAAFDSLLSVQAANGMMYYNAVANQQKTNMLGMAMTAKCVRYMLDANAGDNVDNWISEDE